MRFILIAVVVLLAVWLLRRALSGPHGKPNDQARKPEDGAQGELVACARCDVNLPRSEARSAGGRYYCGEEHLRLGPREG